MQELTHQSGLRPVYIVQGAQWGSEGKGQVAACLIPHYGIAAAVRTGSINAGHTVYHRNPYGEEEAFKMQLLPTAWVHPGVKLVLGPGCFIHRELLAREVLAIKRATGEDVRGRLFIDYRCTVHSPEAEREGHESPRHHAMGSTGKGSSNAVIERLMARGDLPAAEALLFRSYPKATDPEAKVTLDFEQCLTDTSALLHQQLLTRPVLLEGTQGTHLDVFTGPYPYVSNRPVSTAAWLAYAGLAPTLDVRPILVARTYPIRVAGNSGPMANEWNWCGLYDYLRDICPLGARHAIPHIPEDHLSRYELELRTALAAMGCTNTHYIERWTDAQRVADRVALSEAPTRAFSACPPEMQKSLAKFFEMTTVTKKIRRVSRWNYTDVQEAIRLNGCHALWVSFLNYQYPETWGTTRWPTGRADDWLRTVSGHLGVPILGVSTERYPHNHLIQPV